MQQTVAIASVALAGATCPGFTSSNLRQCGGLTKQPHISDAQSCSDLCCQDSDCDTWQFCPERTGDDVSGCSGWGGSRCWTGKAGSCSSKTHWIGGSKQPSPSPPVPPAPTPTPSPPAPTPTPSGAVSRKRGFSGFLGDFTCEDAALLKLDDSWHYTWQGEHPTQGGKCDAQKVSSEFVPMVIGVKCPGYAEGECTATLEKSIDSLNTDSVRKVWKEHNAQFLLGYNEPDAGNGKHNHPHEVSPADAAAAWPKVQELAASMSPPLTLVSPSVASGHESGGRDCWDADGRSTWMDDFLGNCTHVVKDCDPSLIKYIGMHDYHGSVTALKRKVDGAAKLYGRKVWLTELAITDWGHPPSMEVQSAFMEEVLPYLDSSENVFRYSWFSARNAPNQQNGGSNLLATDGSKTVTSIGKIYRDTPDAQVVIV